jgi:hypothetical protein
MNRFALVLSCLAMPVFAADESVSPINLDAARQQFQAAQEICGRTMRISADWGVLEVQNGALLKPDWSAVSVAAPTIMGATLKGDGWTLELKPNWKVVPAERNGDFTLAGPPQ